MSAAVVLCDVCSEWTDSTSTPSFAPAVGSSVTLSLSQTRATSTALTTSSSSGRLAHANAQPKFACSSNASDCFAFSRILTEVMIRKPWFALVIPRDGSTQQAGQEQEQRILPALAYVQ